MKTSMSVIHRPELRTGALLALLTSSPSAPSLAQELFLLRMEAPMGRVAQYHTQTKSWLPGFPTDSNLPSMVMTDSTTETIIAVEGDSRTTRIVVVSDRLDMSTYPRELPENVWKGMTTVSRIDNRGRVLASEITQKGREGAGPRAPHASSTFTLPEAPVRVGDTWGATETMPMGPGTGGLWTAILQVNYRLERVDLKGGARVAVISMKGAGTAWLKRVGQSPNQRLEKSLRPASGTISGEILMDLDAKWMVGLTVSMEDEWGTTHGLKTHMTKTSQ